MKENYNLNRKRTLGIKRAFISKSIKNPLEHPLRSSPMSNAPQVNYKVNKDKNEQDVKAFKDNPPGRLLEP